MNRSIKCQEDSHMIKSKTLYNNIPVSEGIYSELECEQCSEQKQSKCFDELTADMVSKLTPHMSLEPQTLARCLELKPTLDNDDNIFNCIFGRLDMYGTYVCTDGEQHREDLSDCFKSDEFMKQNQNELIPILQQFILGATDNTNFPRAFQVQSDIREFEQNKSGDLKVLKKELENPENEEVFGALYRLYSDETAPNEELNKQRMKEKILEQCGSELKAILESIDDPLEKVLFDPLIIEEYSKYLTSPWQKLGLPELNLIALATSKQIHVYEEASESEDIFTVQHVGTINSRGDNELYVLMNEDDSFQRLDLNSQRFNFQMQSACQAKVYKKLVSELRPSKMKDVAKIYLLVKKVAKQWMELLGKDKKEKPKWYAVFDSA